MSREGHTVSEVCLMWPFPDKFNILFFFYFQLFQFHNLIVQLFSSFSDFQDKSEFLHKTFYLFFLKRVV